MTIKELKAEAYSLYDMIYNVGCYSVNDMIRLEMTFQELERRGYWIDDYSHATLKIHK